MYGYKPRPRRPYEKKQISKTGAILFGMGLGAMLAIVAILAGLAIPYLGSRLEYRFRTYSRKLIPHPQYLPTPAPTVSTANLPLPTAGHAAPPTPTPTLTEETTIPTPTLPTESPPPLIALEGVEHQWQTWNNCGPATITMYMSYFGHSETQADAAPFLKPNEDDKNVSPQELAAYARTTGLQALVRYGGSIELLKEFLDEGLPILAETWLVHEGDGLGHYRLVIGYDEAARELITMDSLNGPRYRVAYEQFEAHWRVFNYAYLVLFTNQQAPLILDIIGEDMNDTVMYERLAAQAVAQVEANPEDTIAYFNLGEALTRLGRPEEAVIAFDRARQLGLHWRRLWYQFTPFEAYYAVGRYQDVLDLSEATLKVAGGPEEVFYYHGLALQATGQPGAREDFEAALEYNPNFSPATTALAGE